MLRALAIGAAALGAMFGTRALLNMSRRTDFTDKVVLIAGGSRGLGFVLARYFVEQNARVALLSRDRQRLAAAAQELRDAGGKVITCVCDIRSRVQVEEAVSEVHARLGPVDVLVNDAGIIQVGPLDTLTYDDYRDAMDTHFWGPLHLTMAVLPEMRTRRSGRICNITSIGGKASVPHLLPYCASKFAQVGLSEGLRAELLKDNVLVTTVCPGMMRTGSHVNAEFKGKHQAEYAWFSIGNGLPVSSVSADTAARQIVEAIRFGRAELIISLPAQVISKLVGMFPGVTGDLFGLVNVLLPSANGTGTRKYLGSESKSWIAPSPLTHLSDRQAPRNNEV